jgi:AMP-polyphosphate phosphotransferase
LFRTEYAIHNHEGSTDMGDQGLQPDMHLKPLDNAALLKPLRKAADAPAAPVPDEKPEAAPIAEPKRWITPVLRPKKSAAPVLPDDDDEEDLFSLPKSAFIKPVEEPPFAPDDDDEDEAPAPAAQPEPPTPVAAADNVVIPPPSLPDEDDDDEGDDEDDEDEDEAPAPTTQLEPPMPVAAVDNVVIPSPPMPDEDDDEDDEDEDEAPTPAAQPEPPMPVAAVDNVVIPPLSLPDEDDDEDDEDEEETSAPAAQPEPPMPDAVMDDLVIPPPPMPDEDDEDDDEDEEESPAPAAQPEADAEPDAPAHKPPTSYRPTDEQVHMMELMKSIFANALNTGLPGGQPPQITPPEPKQSMSDLREELMMLQQKIREAEIPVVIVIEGLSASGKGTMLGKLIEGLDSRGYQAHPIHKPDCVEASYPVMRRYWTDMPKKGAIALFCSSWYSELNQACLEREDELPEILPQRLNEIISMESQLVCDGALILKFFLHISRQEQYDRLQAMEGKKSTAWHVAEKDHEQNKRYDEYMKGMDNLMSVTNLKGAPWHILDASDLKACGREIYETVIRAFKDALQARQTGLRPWDVPMLPNLSPISSLGFPPLKSIDLNKHLDASYKDERKRLTKKLKKLQETLYRRGIPLIAAFEGWDAAGKGGTIQRLTSALDARGFDVAPISAPTPLEQSHHYLWRFFQELPPKGYITVFDRTWYGRVMVERVEGLCTKPQWQRAYEEINRFEKLWTDAGGLLCKFWLQVSPDTQLERFSDRQADPEKQWKLTDEDWRNREKWPQYEQAVNEVLQRTHTSNAPWTVVEADDKDYARIKVLKTVIDTIEKHLDKDDDGE